MHELTLSMSYAKQYVGRLASCFECWRLYQATGNSA